MVEVNAGAPGRVPIATKSTVRAPRLATPSEKQALGLLPENMFVTSVELENDGQGNWDRRKKKKMRDVYSGEQQNGNAEVVELDYGTPGVGGDPTPANSRDTSTVDWAIVEQNWDRLPVIEKDCTMIDVNQFVGWEGMKCSIVLLRASHS